MLDPALLADNNSHEVYRPLIFNLIEEGHGDELNIHIREKSIIHIADNYREQEKELFLLQNPELAFKPEKEVLFDKHWQKQEQRTSAWRRGRWIFFPWSSNLVHILEEDEFFRVRTSRNRNLITEVEQKKFYDSVIGIAGLSVGNSAALAIVLQGGAKRIRLADPDIFELSNLNRIRSSVASLGISKTFLTARQIYEINPYAEVEIFNEGLNEDTIEEFFNGPPKLDLLIDEVDNLAVKYLIRKNARQNRTAVLMGADNGDNAVVDIERYDQDPQTRFFHGRMGEVNFELLKKLDKFGIGRMIERHIGSELVTERMKDSAAQMGKTIVSWPQLGGAAMLNGSAVAYCARKILNNQPLKGNRAVVSFDKIFSP